MTDIIEPIVEQVRRRLGEEKGKWPEIARATNVPYFTIANIASGKTTNPTVGTLQPLLDHLGIPVRLVAAEPAVG